MLILLNRGNGTLRSNATYSVGKNPYALTARDFTGDNFPDLLVSTVTNMAVLVNNGDGTFRPPVLYIDLGRAQAVADFNRDGKDDFVAVVGSAGKIGVGLGNGNGTFQVPPFHAALRQPESAAIGDLNGDGWGDIVAANSQDNFVSVLMNRADGPFLPAVNYRTANKPFAVAIGDFNGDGTNDIAATTQNSTNTVSILLANGNGAFQPVLRHGTFGFGGPIAVRDFNGDGKLDLICNSLSGVQVQLGNGNGTFQPVGGLVGEIAFGPGSMAIADFNNDRTNDMALTAGSTNVSIYLGHTNGTFRTAVNRYLTGTNTQSVVAGDFNGDGTNDLAAANFGELTGAGGSVSILIGNGNGTFRAPVHYAAGGRPRFINAADFNGDGISDLAVRTLNGYAVGILLGKGDGTFGLPFEFAARQDATFEAIAVGDLNRDGKPDMALPNLADSVSVFLNTCASARPQVSIAGFSSALSLSWPVSFGGFNLQFTTNLSSAWLPVTGPFATNDGNIQFTAPYDRLQRFFRLGQ